MLKGKVKGSQRSEKKLGKLGGKGLLSTVWTSLSVLMASELKVPFPRSVALGWHSGKLLLAEAVGRKGSTTAGLELAGFFLVF